MSPFVAEFIGTMLLVLFGNGVVANMVFARTKGNDGGWIVIAAGWGIAAYRWAAPPGMRSIRRVTWARDWFTP